MDRISLHHMTVPLQWDAKVIGCGLFTSATFAGLALLATVLARKVLGKQPLWRASVAVPAVITGAGAGAVAGPFLFLLFEKAVQSRPPLASQQRSSHDQPIRRRQSESSSSTTESPKHDALSEDTANSTLALPESTTQTSTPQHVPTPPSQNLFRLPTIADGIAELHAAVKAGDLDTVNRCDCGIVNCPDSSGRPPLWYAIEEEREDIVRALLAKEAKPLLYVEGETLLHVAVDKSTAILEMLASKVIEHKGDIDTRDSKGCTPLAKAVKLQKLDVVKVLMVHHALALLVDTSDTDLLTPLHFAAASNAEILREILKYVPRNRVDTRSGTHEGLTPLCCTTSKEAANLLLASGADPLCKIGIVETTPLHKATVRGKQRVLEALLANLAHEGKDINTKNVHGHTPLASAVYACNKEAVQLLLAFGADPLIGNSSGETPLHEAAMFGYSEILRVLANKVVEQGKNIDIKDNDGRTAWSYAQEEKQEEAQQILTQHGAKPV